MIAEYQNKFNSAIVETLLDMDARSQSSLEHLINVVGQNQYDRGVITTDPATSIMPMRVSIPRRYSRATGKRYTMLPCFLLPHYQYTKSFIFLTLYCYKCRRCQSVRDLCSRTGIAVTLYAGPELSDSPVSSDCDQIKTDCTASGAYQMPNDCSVPDNGN